MMVFCGDDLLMARMRRADIDGSDGTVQMLQLVVPMLREQWPSAEIVLRADSAFAREAIMSWCEGNGVHYVIGLARNGRLRSRGEPQLAEAKAELQQTGRPARRFTEFAWATLKSWSRERRVVAKAEHIPGKANPRFVVTSLRESPATLYEQVYCQRGEAENRIREHQQDLFGHQASCTKMRANQLRLWLSSLAYLLMNELRRVGLAGTEMARCQAATIRSRLLKIGALVMVSRRRVKLSFSRFHPARDTYAAALQAITSAWELQPP